MLCSISTQKSGGTKWPDRLRSSKGFPSGDLVNFEEMHHHTFSTLDSATINLTSPRSEGIRSECCSFGAESEKEQVLEGSVDGEGKELFNAFSHVLAELFNMGEPSNYVVHKKVSRKQSNPRLFAASTSSECNNVSGPGDEQRAEIKTVNSKLKQLEPGQNLVPSEEEVNINSTAMGFSRSEVTVIDTSCTPWKFDKLLLRQKNVWKVRDKGTKTTYLGKKRNEIAEHDNVGGTKKQKAFSGEESKLPKNEGLQPRDKFEDVCRNTSDTVRSTLEKKNRNFALKKAKSSVVLIQNIPTSKKIGIWIPRKASHRPSTS
ncbi:unnamed protein product [Cuscuta campestris]|uniref:Uncharacterized protein n=1 Tax=Cuscuta campestris TaxID=132261 RepID=A0A484NEB1_9ASTE|nr:unnamed protein product [Cuscuta campestris]